MSLRCFIASASSELAKNGEALTSGDIPIGQLVSRFYKLPITHPVLPRIRD